ncbi:mitochondrial long-chain specific acyl-CoA dehydrogenase [Podospora australis]|uniref:Mitochondrial long-chain specific acyl-CoA dehydrogenase n=1 Tax=Podospora australis TaxID=1536484 RepID=A0AAN6X2W7_9PEZI|nr:mitochondrial long-chain specific acyl-CoA dehydrogenase [Podospora australis]
MTNAQIPFSEPPWLTGLPSPYFSPSHFKWQAAIREFITKHLHSHAVEWEQAETLPPTVFEEFAAAGMLLPALPAPLPVKWLKKLGIHTLLGDLPVEEFDSLHGYIYGDEMSRMGLAGPPGSLTTGIAFGVPLILKFGSEQLQERYIPDLLRGKKRACIAITEPDAGSDVAGITTTAVKSEDGREWVVNGSKKWITNGIWSDYASMAVRTGPPGSGAAGISLLVVPLKGHPGVSMRRLKVAGQVSAGTTYIELDDVRVPIENLIGKENHGMRYIMTNFNHERLAVATGTTRQARVALSAAFEYVMKREAFGKALIEQPVVRHRLAKAGAALESLTAWVEQFAYLMTKLPEEEANVKLGGLTALLKAHAGMVFKECADTAVLLFGGNGFTRSGQGMIAEMLYREVPGTRIPGGSEDVLLDLAVRQLVKIYKMQTKLLEKGSAKL